MLHHAVGIHILRAHCLSCLSKKICQKRISSAAAKGGAAKDTAVLDKRPCFHPFCRKVFLGVNRYLAAGSHVHQNRVPDISHRAKETRLIVACRDADRNSPAVPQNPKFIRHFRKHSAIQMQIVKDLFLKAAIPDIIKPKPRRISRMEQWAISLCQHHSQIIRDRAQADRRLRHQPCHTVVDMGCHPVTGI